MLEHKFVAIGTASGGRENFVISVKDNVDWQTKTDFAKEVLEMINAGGGVTAYADMDSITIHEVTSTLKVPIVEVPESELYAMRSLSNTRFNLGGINPDGILTAGLLGLAGYAFGKSMMKNDVNRRLPD